VIPVAREYADADLLIVGDGTHREALQSIAAGSERVRFIGRVPADQVDRYYEHAIAVVVPSEGYETFGFVAIEAFRRGAPIIARRQGSLIEFVEASGGGALFSTPDELRDHMHEMQAGSQRDVLGRAGRAAFLEHWSERTVLPRYLSVIQDAAAARGATHVLDALGTARPA
jgi:glycosyltransferase involved in cell wall biosynthesis